MLPHPPVELSGTERASSSSIWSAQLFLGASFAVVCLPDALGFALAFALPFPCCMFPLTLPLPHGPLDTRPHPPLDEATDLVSPLTGGGAPALWAPRGSLGVWPRPLSEGGGRVEGPAAVFAGTADGALATAGADLPLPFIR